MNNITTIQTTIYRLIAEQLGIPESQIALESTLESLGADSIDRVTLVMTLEDEFGLEIADAEFEDIETVRQVIELAGRLRDDR